MKMILPSNDFYTGAAVRRENVLIDIFSLMLYFFYAQM